MKKNNWKRILSLGLCAGMLLGTAAMVSAEEAESFDVTFIVKQASDPFATWLTDSILSIAEDEYPQFNITTLDGNSDHAKRIELLENVVLDEPDMLILQYFDESEIPTIKSVIDAGIPVVVTNGHYEDDGMTNYVDTNPATQGELIGTVAAEQLPENAKIVVMTGPTANYHSVNRYENFTKVLAEQRPDVEILATQEANWNKDEAITLMEDWLTKYDQIDGIVACNDNMALGAIDAVKAAGRYEDGFMAFGIDGLADACLSIQAGELNASVVQDAFQLADLTLQVVNDYLVEGNTEMQYLMIPDVELNADNVEEWIETYREFGMIE